VQDFNVEGNNSNATSLGGPNRLRSYPISRFYDTHSLFAGLEYRTYHLESSTPFDFFLEKGVFEAVQSAVFYEIGQVAPTDNHALYSDFKYSAGVGLRLIFSSVVLRADYATGKEGQETTVFIGYGF
jgi:outer membrane protein assembly factor BamA